MCIICIDYQLGKLTVEEGWKNLAEMVEEISTEHKEEVEDMLWHGMLNGMMQKADIEIDDRDEGNDWYSNHGQGD